MPRLALIDLLPLAAFVACALPLGIAFAWRAGSGRLTSSTRFAQLPRSPYLPRPLMELGYFAFARPVAWLAALGISPDLVTYGSLLLSLAGGVALGAGLFAVGGFILLLAFALDAWDGMLARATGRASVRGEYLDAVVDRYSDQAAFFGLLYYYRNDPLPLCAATGALVGASLVSYTRAKGEAVGARTDGGFMQRHERAVWLGLGTLVAPLGAAWLEPGSVHPRYHLTVLVLAVIALATQVTTVIRTRNVLLELGGRP
jgi:CDP-diacylglycerol--glycerol-3-phosphate 3-phosphatidyltransferase